MAVPEGMDIDKVAAGLNLTRRLVEAGFDVDYLNAMIVDGLGIGPHSNTRFIGEHYTNRDRWCKRVRNSLVQRCRTYSRKVATRHEKMLNGVLRYKSKECKRRCISLSPRWHSESSGALRDYLQLYL